MRYTILMPYRHRVYTVLFIWILIACTGAKSVLAADTTILNARILPTIWFSDLTVQAGDTVRIYGAIQNNAGQNISGSAQFYLDQELFTAIDFTSTNNSLKEISIPWIAVVGEHTVHISLNADLPASTTLTSITSDEATIRVLKPASTSTVTQIILETTKNIIEKTDALASDVTTALSDLKKDLPGLITPSTTPSLARGTTTEIVV